MGIKAKRFEISESQLPSVIANFGCSVLGGFALVREGVQTWKESSESIVELILKALGVPASNAKMLAIKQYF